ncbi:rhomboid family intramembrane serine protease [Alteromonas sp. C1M14]|uniref:rhomboid family intramembrane serine protease n=1 Tax=Alteromonas sp. C1M14 TaxID=2841567 RepID=UPI001C0948AC|nr:rhomboid family intramembrane serine protease [Alteromonas sp. C1M14]MBU2977783.1 rhomboid family intramembrane serine protease [Alteromonas sp. C1M14]
MKTCPNCASREMKKQQFHQQEVEQCQDCHGIWLDSGELDSALSIADNGHSQVVLEEALGKMLGESQRHCHDCDIKLIRYYLMPGFEVEIDCCPRCSGVWLDHHELEKVTHSPAIATALLELDKPTKKRTWLFQFLSQMPVEYNLKPKKTPWVMYSLVALNILFFLSYISDVVDISTAFDSFAMHSGEVSHGQQLWTLLTYMYMHGGLIHLAGNMYFLYIIGDNLEDALGHGKFFLYYTLCGLVAAAAQILAEPNSVVPVVGASGAIAGLFGMYLLWFRHASLTLMIIVYQKKVSPLIFFGLWLLTNILGLYLANESGGGVAYWAHIGGFIAGIVIGFAVKKHVFAANPLLAILNSQEVKVKR